MKLLKVGLVANAANGSTCETIISALANQDILEVCTPIVSGIQDSIDSVLANIEQEVQIPICKISRVEDALDGKINIIDCCNTESESIRYMVSSFLNNMVDLIIDLPSEICNSKDETALISLNEKTLLPGNELIGKHLHECRSGMSPPSPCPAGCPKAAYPVPQCPRPYPLSGGATDFEFPHNCVPAGRCS